MVSILEVSDNCDSERIEDNQAIVAPGVVET